MGGGFQPPEPRQGEREGESWVRNLSLGIGGHQFCVLS